LICIHPEFKATIIPYAFIHEPYFKSIDRFLNNLTYITYPIYRIFIDNPFLTAVLKYNPNSKNCEIILT